MKFLKFNHLIALVGIGGYFVLLFFPEPQTNFLAYLATVLFFLALIIFIIKLKNKK